MKKSGVGGGLAGKDEIVDFFAQVSAAEFGLGVADGHGVGGRFANDEDLFLTAGNRGVEEIALEHHEVSFEDRHDDDGVLAALTFVDTDAIGEGDVAEFSAGKRMLIAIEISHEGAGFGINVGDDADIAVEKVFVVVVAELDDFVAGAIFAAGSAE